MGRRTRRAGGYRANRWWKPLAFGAAAVVLLGAAIFLILAPLRTVMPAPDLPSGVQRVVVSMGGFSPGRLQAKAGQDLTITLVNPDSRFHTDGGGWHQFRIETLNMDVRIPPSSARTVILRGLRAGVYEFYCDVCCGGKENPSMRGTLEVTG